MGTRCAVIGAGAWGTTIAQCLADNDHEVVLWCYKDAIANAINESHSHHRLPGVSLNPAIQAVSELSHCYDADYVVLGLSSSQLLLMDTRIDWSQIKGPVGIIAKGLIQPDLFISDWLHSRVNQPVFVISGRI